MASPSLSPFSILLLLLITTVTAVPELEYNSLLSALRNRGYHVFANAITTTDLHYDIITGSNFTFFAPIDSVLYTLDMSMSAADYTTTLRFHVVPHRLSLSDLRNLPYGLSSFPTLLNDHQIRVVNPLSLPLPITVEGVYISVPDLYADENVVVHGLESVVDFRSVKDTANSPPMNVHREDYASSPSVSDPVTALPPRSTVMTGIDSVTSPTPVPSSAVSESIIQLSQLPELRSVPIIQSQQSPVTTSESIIQSHSPVTNSESIIQSHSPVTKSESIMKSHYPVSKSEPVFQLQQSPETKSESIIQSKSPEVKSESIQSHKPPKTKSESIIHTKLPEAKSESIMQSKKSPKVYFESVSQPLEEHVTIAARSEVNAQKIHHVSLATKSSGDFEQDFTQVDDRIIDCPITDEDGEEMNIANIRRGDPYTRQLYTANRMTCAHE